MQLQCRTWIPAQYHNNNNNKVVVVALSGYCGEKKGKEMSVNV